MSAERREVLLKMFREPPPPLPPLPADRVVPVRHLVNIYGENGESLWVERQPGNWLDPSDGSYSYRK